ncbi:MAG: hypothetical protein VX777_00230 [Chlamydiota bacterium]|nr:hypothetical protein [Chlamydiota bacterium]
MEKDLEQRLEARSKLLNEADACEAQLHEQDRLIHDTYHSLLKHRDKAMSHLDFLGRSINFISPLLEAELPGAGYAVHGAQGLIGLGMSEHGAHKSNLEKKYQQSLSAAEQNHYQLQNTKGTLTQQVNIINQNIMQHRLLLLQSAEMANPSDYLIKLRKSIDKNNQKIQDEEKSIKSLQTNIEFNTDMASKLDKQSAGLLTDHNRKHHKKRYQDGINQRNQANELRNKNIQLKLELTTKQENLGAIKRAGDECQEVLEQKNQTENLDLFFYNLVRDEVNSQLSQDPKTATIRETVFREWYNYQFAKGQRVNAVNQMFMASDGVIGELTALAARWNQPDLAKYGQKGQILMNMGRNLYVVTDCYSTMSAGLSSITKILEDNSGSTFIDAVKLMGPTNFLNFCLNPGLQVLSAGLGCIRLGSYLFGNSSTVNDGLSHLHQVLQSVSDQIHFQMNQIHENLKFQDQKTEKLFKEMSDQIEILHKDITNEIRISKEAILSEIDLKKNLDEAEKLQEKSEKIRNEVSKLCDKMISSEDHSIKSKYAVKLMSLLDAELRNSLSNSSRGLINVRDKLGGEKIIRPVVSVHAVIEYPHLFSAVLAKYVGLKSEVPNTDLLLTIIDCYTSSIQTFPKETIEKNTPLIEKIEESIRTQSKMVRNLFDFIDKYTQKVYKQQVKVLNSWKKQLHNNAILDNQFEINAFISAVKNMPANVEISGKERYKLAELLKNTSIYQPELGSSLVGDTGKSVGVVGTSVGAGGAVAISGKVGLAIGAISAKASATLGLSVLCPVAGITLAGAGVTAGVIYGAVKAGQHFVEWLNEPTDEQIAILKKLTPANFMCESEKLAPLSGKKVVKIEFHFDADGKCQYIFEQPPKEKKEDDENVHLLSVSKILRESNKHDTTVFKNSLISISEASKVQDVDLPENLNEYEKAATELVNTYKSWLKKEAGIESGGQLDNPFDVFLEGGKPVTSLNPTLVSLVFPKELLDHCEHLLSYEKCVMSMKGAGGLAPSYRFEKRNDKYVLTLDYHYINTITKEQLDIQGFEILEVDAVSVESFSNSEVSGQDPVVNLNQFLIQAMYTSALSSEKKKGILGIPGNATVIFNGIKQIVPSEREFPGFYMLMKKNPREKIIFNCWDFDAQKSQEVMNYAFTNDCSVNPLVTFRITACALAQSYKFKRVTKEVGDKLADNLKALKKHYNNLHAFLCFASSLSDVEIKMALERYSGIIEPTNVETLLQLISADLLPFNVDPKEKVAPSNIIQSFLSSEIKKISEFTHL